MSGPSKPTVNLSAKDPASAQHDSVDSFKTFDVVVVGAGPAGSTLSILCARAGLSVALIEAKSFPREKVCGEFISTEGIEVLQRLGLWSDLKLEHEPNKNSFGYKKQQLEKNTPNSISNGLPRIIDWRITATTDHVLEGTLPQWNKRLPASIGWSRSAMDAALMQEAKASGVTVLQPCKFITSQKKSGLHHSVVQHFSESKSPTTLISRVLVAADGRKSKLGKELQARHKLDPAQSKAGWWGLKTHVQVEGNIPPRVDLHLLDQGYVGCSPIEHNQLNLCFLLRPHALKHLAPDFNQTVPSVMHSNLTLARESKAFKYSKPWQVVGPLRFGVRSAASGGVFFVGDAAGTVDPFVGEGISHAFMSAEALAPILINALSKPSGVTLMDEARWQELWENLFFRISTRTRLMGRLFEHPRLGSMAIRTLKHLPRVTDHLITLSRTASTSTSQERMS